jgi:hypothetical protein
MCEMSNLLPKPKLRDFDGVTVIDDTEVGTKFRMAVAMIGSSPCQTFNFASSPFGESPLAMAEACTQLERKLNLFYPDVPLEQFTPQMKQAKEMGANIIPVTGTEDHLYVSAEAKRQAGHFISFDSVEAIAIIADTARSLKISPDHVWAAGGLGGITRGLQAAWTNASHHTVAVTRLAQADYGKARVIYIDTPFRQAAETPTPFPCNPYFEGKAWAVMQEHRNQQSNIVFWNPARR